MEKDFVPEPGDRPDPVVGYYCDPVDRVCQLLKLMLAMQVGNFIVMTAWLTIYTRP